MEGMVEKNEEAGYPRGKRAAPLFCSSLPLLADSSVLCFDEELTTRNETLKLGFDL